MNTNHADIMTLSRRRFFVSAIALLSVITPLASANAQDTLVVLSSDALPYIQAADACQEQLSKAGIITKRVLLSDLSVQEINEISGTVLTIGGRASAQLAQEINPSTHLYYCMSPNPDRLGLTERPFTSGISTDISVQDQVSVIRGSMPTAKRIGALYRSSSMRSQSRVESFRKLIPDNWELVLVDLDDDKSASTGINKLLSMKIDLVWTAADTAVFNSATIRALLLESLHQRIPVFGFSHALVRSGATFGVGISPSEQGLFVADLITRGIIDSHHTAISDSAANLIAAERIGITIPGSFINSCTRVFESD